SIQATHQTVGAMRRGKRRPCEVQIIDVRMRSAVGVNDKTAPDVADDAQHDAAGCENDVFVQRTLAETYYDAKRDDASMAAADRALALEPTNVMAMVYKGRVYARKKDWVNAR